MLENICEHTKIEYQGTLQQTVPVYTCLDACKRTVSLKKFGGAIDTNDYSMKYDNNRIYLTRK